MPHPGAVFIPPASRDSSEPTPGGRKSAPKGRHNPQSGNREFAIAVEESDPGTEPVPVDSNRSWSSYRSRSCSSNRPRIPSCPSAAAKKTQTTQPVWSARVHVQLQPVDRCRWSHGVLRNYAAFFAVSCRQSRCDVSGNAESGHLGG